MTDYKNLIAEARESLELIGDGDWTPQDTMLDNVLLALESVLAERDPDPLTVEAVAKALSDVDRNHDEGSGDYASSGEYAQAVVRAFGPLVANRTEVLRVLSEVSREWNASGGAGWPDSRSKRQADALLSSGAVEDKAAVQAEVINWIDDNYSLSPGNDDALDRAREHFGLEKR